jgi:hypothetical protein
VAHVDGDEVLLLWRALSAFRSGRRPACAARGKPARSICPLFDRCPRWHEPDDLQLSVEETVDATERRRARWPCSRLLDVLGPDATRIT